MKTNKVQVIEDLIVSELEAVKAFQMDVIGIDIPERPTMLSFKRGEARLAHLREEMAEIEAGVSDERVDDVADGLIDLIYLAHGFLVEMGIATRAAFEEVHRANMTKVRGTIAKRPGAAGFDAVKPAGWKGPSGVQFG